MRCSSVWYQMAVVYSGPLSPNWPPAGVTSCEIDHSIPSISDTPGGSDAGYDRWERFLESNLEGYARTRNDPTITPPAGVSRMSPYLHLGHVAPTRIAREARRAAVAGSEKYIDELIVWRELAFNLCFHRRDVESTTVLPDWARESLGAHVADPRGDLKSWETLARARTGDLSPATPA